MPKASKTSSTARKSRHHNPLEVDISATASIKTRNSKRQPDSHEVAHYVDSKSSRKILQIGQELADEEIEESRSALKSVFDLNYRSTNEPISENAQEYEEWEDEDEQIEETEITDIEAFNKFFPEEQDSLLKHGWGGQVVDEEVGKRDGTNLADIILEKIAAHEASHQANEKRPQSAQDFEIPEKVVEVYTKVGLILSRYKSGKLPKPFKILPTIPRWEEILDITRPDSWTPNACYEATRIFVARSPLIAQRFLERVILERVREEIHETKKLNVHLFNSLKKGLYKPSAWFKGFLFPLIGSGTCTLREAHIISAVLVRVSIPVLHSAAALKGLCDIAAQDLSSESEGGGAINIFISALLDKKYALPYQVIDGLVFHFLRYRNSNPTKTILDDSNNEESFHDEKKEGRLPVLWHQCLLKFAQRYRNDITEDQREALLDLLVEKGHHKIGPEVRRELLEGRGRGSVQEPDITMLDGDDTLMSE